VVVLAFFAFEGLNELHSRWHERLSLLDI